MRPRDFLQAMTVTLLWALCYPFIDLAVSDAPPLSIGAMRATIAGTALLAVARWQHRPRPDREQFASVALAGFGLATLGFAGMFLAGGRIAPGTATVLANLQPLIAAVLGVFVLGESIRGRRGIVLAVAFLGIAITASSSFSVTAQSGAAAGAGFVFLGALGVAIGNLVLKRIAHKIDPVVAAGWALLLGSIPLWLVSALMGDVLPYRFSLGLVVSVTILALLGTALALVLWLDLLRRYELIRVNTFSFMTTIFALLIGATFFQEQRGTAEWLGILLTLAAVVAMGLLGAPPART